ncbi:MAG: hypothetical protein H5U04_10085 [Firmicutes bacterium]|nr:hypothetical protein [Bacillota bacterium]
MWDWIMDQAQKDLRDEMRDFVRGIDRQLILDMDAEQVALPPFGAEGADYFLVYARTDPEAPPHRGLSAFLVERGPGVEVVPG